MIHANVSIIFILSAFCVENPHDVKTFENFTRFEWGVEMGVITTFMLRLFVPHEFDMMLLSYFVRSALPCLSFYSLPFPFFFYRLYSERDK